MHENKLSPSQILEKRQSDDYKTLINDLEDYIASIVPEKESPLYKAINYYKKMNGEEWTYLTDGTVTLDNNEAERQAKKFLIDRNNFLFSKSEKGARASCMLLTIIDFGYVNDLDPRAYLELVLNNIDKRHYDDLLPWSPFIKENINNLQ